MIHYSFSPECTTILLLKQPGGDFYEQIAVDSTTKAAHESTIPPHRKGRLDAELPWHWLADNTDLMLKPITY